MSCAFRRRCSLPRSPRWATSHTLTLTLPLTLPLTRTLPRTLTLTVTLTLTLTVTLILALALTPTLPLALARGGASPSAQVALGAGLGACLATLVYCTRPHPPFGAQDLVEEADYPALGALRGLGRVEPGELYVESY